MLISQPLKGIKIYRTIFYIPAVVSGVATSVIWSWVLNGDYGVLNYLLSFIGIEGPKWLVDLRGRFWRSLSLALSESGL